MLLRAATSLLCKNVSACEERSDSFAHDGLFDIDIPRKIFVSPKKVQQDLYSTAHRCMNNWCFLKPARAYVLGLYADHAALNRLKTHDTGDREVFRTDFPKSFVLFFASSKNSEHVKNGFRRSFETFVRSQKSEAFPLTLISEFLTVMDGREGLRRNDFIRVSCVPSKNLVIVSFNDETEVQIRDGKGLIHWMHSLYLGLEENPKARYSIMQGELLHKSNS